MNRARDAFVNGLSSAGPADIMIVSDPPSQAGFASVFSDSDYRVKRSALQARVRRLVLAAREALPTRMPPPCR